MLPVNGKQSLEMSEWLSFPRWIPTYCWKVWLGVALWCSWCKSQYIAFLNQFDVARRYCLWHWISTRSSQLLLIMRWCGEQSIALNCNILSSAFWDTTFILVSSTHSACANVEPLYSYAGVRLVCWGCVMVCGSCVASPVLWQPLLVLLPFPLQSSRHSYHLVYTP